MPCLICGIHEVDASIEHIVPESLGNEHYTLPRGNLCKKHNNLFSEFESKALTKTILGMERARSGIKTKKGRPATSKTGAIQFTGDEQFRKNFVRVNGLTEEDILDFDPVTKTFKIHVQGFDKTEVPTSKLLLKIGLESLLKSQKKIFANYNLTEAIEYLDNKTNKDWPFLTTQLELHDFKSIPKFIDKHRLSKIRCSLLISEIDNQTLVFKFVYCGVSLVINLAGRHLLWISPYIKSGGKTELYPAHMRKKLGSTE